MINDVRLRDSIRITEFSYVFWSSVFSIRYVPTQWRICIVKFWTRKSPGVQYLLEVTFCYWIFCVHIVKPLMPILFPGQTYFIFMQFSGKFGQIIGCPPPWACSPLGNPGFILLPNSLNLPRLEIRKT